MREESGLYESVSKAPNRVGCCELGVRPPESDGCKLQRGSEKQAQLPTRARLKVGRVFAR